MTTKGDNKWWQKYFEADKQEIDSEVAREQAISDFEMVSVEDLKTISNSDHGLQEEMYRLNDYLEDKKNISLEALNFIIEKYGSASNSSQMQSDRSRIFKKVVFSPSFERLPFEQQKKLYGYKNDPVYDEKWANPLKVKLLSHSDCTEKDVVDIAEKEHYKSWDAEENREVWAKMILDPNCSDELGNRILSNNLIHKDTIDGYMRQDNCPPKILLAAVESSLDKVYSRYRRNHCYTLDGTRLLEIANRKDVTEEVLNKIASYTAGEFLETSNYGDIENKDTCVTKGCYRTDIMAAVLDNKNCSEKTAMKLYSALDTIPQDAAANCAKLIDGKFPEVALRVKVEKAKQNTQERGVDFVDMKESGNLEFNKALIKAKMFKHSEKGDDPLIDKKPGNIKLNKMIIQKNRNTR